MKAAPDKETTVTHGVKKIRMRSGSGRRSSRAAARRELFECRSGGWGMVNRGR